MSYTPKQLRALAEAKTRLDTTGKPEVVAKIDYMIETNAPFDDIFAISQGTIQEVVKAEKDVDLANLIPAPPFDGKGSGYQAWRDFALTVSDIEPEIIDALTRNDLITVLIDRGVIPAPDSSFSYKPAESVVTVDDDEDDVVDPDGEEE